MRNKNITAILKFSNKKYLTWGTGELLVIAGPPGTVIPYCTINSSISRGAFVGTCLSSTAQLTGGHVTLLRGRVILRVAGVVWG